jgi:hypothetical protein
MHRAAPARDDGREDELLRLQQENSKLKKNNMEQNEHVKKLGVQLTRIKHDMASSTTPSGLAPVAKARAAAEVSKADKISALEVELSQREFREQKLQQQLQLLRQQVGTGGGGGATRPGSARPSGQRPLAVPGVTRMRTSAARTSASSGRDALSSSQSASASALGATVGSSGGGGPGSPSRRGGEGGGGGSADRVGTLLQMIRDKDKTLDEMRARLSLVEQAHADADQAVAGAVGGYGSAGEAAADGALGGLSAGVSEGAVGAELRRQLKKGAFEMSLLEQRYTHLETRFNTLRENHERVRGRFPPPGRPLAPACSTLPAPRPAFRPSAPRYPLFSRPCASSSPFSMRTLLQPPSSYRGPR